MDLEEYTNLTEKNYFFVSTNITTPEEFDAIYDEKTKEVDLLFRGIHEAKYKIYTSAQREWLKKGYREQGFHYEKFIQSIINNIRNNKILSNYYKSLNINENDLLYISLLQHYGAPTPLLDFTHNFEIALHFALEKTQLIQSDNEIDNYFSIYIIDKRKCGTNLVDIISLLKKGLELGKKQLEEFLDMYAYQPNTFVDYSVLCNVDKYTKWIKNDGSKDGLHKIDCSFLDNPLNSETISMYKTNNVLYWSNINLIAQQGCFILYTKDKEPLEQYFGFINSELPKLCCINIHKSLAEYIKNKYITDRLDIYPDMKLMCIDAYEDFKKEYWQIQ